eukprot:341916_1
MTLLLVILFCVWVECIYGSRSTCPRNTTADIVIIGAGITGLLQGHLLQAQYPEKTILIIEKLNRTGGRHLSSKLTMNDESITVEHGAMRTYYSHPFTMKILHYLNLCDDLIPLEDTHDSDDTLFETRNNHVLTRDLSSSFWINSYHLNNHDRIKVIDELDKSPYEAFINFGLQQLFIENNKTCLPSTKQEWYEFRNEWTFSNITLNKWSLYTWIRAMNFSLEFVNMLYDIHVLPKYIQLGTFLTLILHTRTEQSYTIKNGYREMSRRLQKLIGDDNIVLGNKVIGVDQINHHQYIVRTDNNNNVIAKQIILSIPANDLQVLLPHIPILTDSKVLNLL